MSAGDEMLKWVGGVALALVGFVAGLYALGAMEPAEHVISRRAKFSKPPAALWALLADPTQQTKWRRDVLHVAPVTLPSGAQGFEEQWRNGAKLLTEITVIDPGRTLQSRVVNTNLPYGGTTTYEFTLAGEGTELRLTEKGFIRSPFMRFFTKYVFGYGSSVDGVLHLVGLHFGDNVTPDD